MEREFTIQLSVKTPEGFIAFGEYNADWNREAANALFEKLQGSPGHTDGSILFIDLLELMDGLPATVRSLSCTLDELCYNSKLIAKEVFCQKNLKVN